jgi:hypothetical protein
MTYDPLENFHVLHKCEERIRAQSIEAINASESFRVHAELIEHTMSLLWYFIREHQSPSEDVRTVQLFGVRLFNATASVLKLLLSGYYQTSLLQHRDLVETIFLLDYFRTDQSLIAEWRNGERNGTGVPPALEQKARVIHQAERIAQDRFRLNQALQIRHGFRRQGSLRRTRLVCHRLTSSFGRSVWLHDGLARHWRRRQDLSAHPSCAGLVDGDSRGRATYPQKSPASGPEIVSYRVTS